MPCGTYYFGCSSDPYIKYLLRERQKSQLKKEFITKSKDPENQNEGKLDEEKPATE